MRKLNIVEKLRMAVFNKFGCYLSVLIHCVIKPKNLLGKYVCIGTIRFTCNLYIIYIVWVYDLFSLLYSTFHILFIS